MKCITRYEMKFGDIIIPERTECIIVNKDDRFTPNAPGVSLDVVVDNYDIKKKYIANENKVIKFRNNVNNASLKGFLIDTNTESVYMDADNKIYYDYRISEWQLEKIFGKGKIPDGILIKDYGWRETELFKVIEYLDEEFSDWVSGNCEFIKLTAEDIENGVGLSDSEPGDKVLSDGGMIEFENKCYEYKRILEEATGFTYKFKGGLIWE